MEKKDNSFESSLNLLLSTEPMRWHTLWRDSKNALISLSPSIFGMWFSQVFMEYVGMHVDETCVCFLHL